jgi:hypothetical protein
MKRLTELLLTTLLILFSCSSGKRERDNLHIIKIENYINKWEQINLSQFSHNIRYILLQSSENPLSFIHLDCLFSDSLILAKDYSNCILYDLHGKFLRKIGSKGRGPGEYLLVPNADFGRNGNIYLKGSYDLIEYSVDGKFIYRYKNILKNNSGSVGNWLQINDSLFLGYVANSTGLEENRFIIFNKQGNVKYALKNYRILNRERSFFSDQESYADLYRFENQIFVKQIVNDTLFILTSDFKLQPKYVFDFGKYSYQPFLGGPGELMEYSLNQGNKIWINNLFQIHDYYFLCCDFHFNFPAKRLTTKSVREGITTDYNTTLALGVLNKKTNELSFCKPTETDNPLFTTGFFNDIDGGPRFYPMRMVNDSTMVMWIDATQFKEHIKSQDFIYSQPLFPEKKQALIDFASRITIYDNAVLMFVTFKKDISPD